MIRAATPDDERALRALDRSTWSSLSSPVPAPGAEREFEIAGVLVSELEDGIAGYVKVGQMLPIDSNRHVLEIKGIAVSNAHRRRGVGRALMHAAIAFAREAGARKLMLRVLSHNAAARDLYAGCGFEVEGVLREFFYLDGRYVDDIFMSLSLSPRGRVDGDMADLAAPPSASEVRSLGGLALAAADRHTGDAMRAPGRAPITYAEFGRAVHEIAGGLASMGVGVGDRVAILCGTVPEWTLADFGAFCSGATVVPVYHTNSPEECEYVLSHAGARVIFVEDAAQAAKIASVREALGELEHVIVLSGEAEGALTLAALRERGAADGEAIARERVAAIDPDDAATIVYTSGTTGPPKGCVLSHANLIYTAGAYTDRLGLREAQPIIFQYLPLAHVLARMVSFVCLDVGGTLAFWGGDTKNLAADIGEAKPTHIPTVPRLLEKIQTRVVGTAEAAGGAKAAIFKRALATGERVAKAQREGRKVGPIDRWRHSVGDRLALSKVREALGPNHPVILTGAAPIGAEVIEFFYACGIPVLEGYGMTETCAAATLNTVQEVRVGSVGRPLPGVDVSIAEDGEILMRGPLIFKGYHRNPEATEAILEDGWLHSGDLGEIIDGYLFVTGRKKDLIITSSGKNVSPETIESALRETRWISQAIVAGDRRSYLVALITLDPDEAPALAASLGVSADPESMASNKKVRDAVWKDIDAVNQRFARIEQIKRFAILPRDLSQEEGELTPTLKVKRAVVYKKFAPDVDALYEGGGATD